jgi:hypothetical protein
MNDFSVREVEVLPMKHIAGRLPRKGKMVIMKDFPESTGWYIADIAKVLNDRFVVREWLVNYKAKSWRARKANLEGLTFHRTWCVNQGRGKVSKSRYFQLLPGTTRQDTIDVDCCVGIQDRRREEDEVSFLHLSFLLIYWLLLVIYEPIVL